MSRVPPPLEWPPLISASRVPRIVLVRDTVLTAIAWFGFGILCADAITLAQDYLRNPAAALPPGHAPDWGGMWAALRGFVLVAVVLVAWLVYWSLVRGRRMRLTGLDPQPPELPLETHATAFGVTARDLAAARELRIATVHFDGQDRVERVSAGDTA